MGPTCQSHTSLCPLSLVCPSATGTAPLFPSASGDDGGALAHGCRGRGGAERCSTLSRRRTISTTATARRLAAVEEGEPSVAAVEDERRARFAPTVVGVLAECLPPSPREPWKEGGRAECRRESDLRLAALRHNHGLQSADAASLPPWPSTDDADDSADLAEPSPAATDSITVGVELATLFLGESRGCS